MIIITSVISNFDPIFFRQLPRYATTHAIGGDEQPRDDETDHGFAHHAESHVQSRDHEGNHSVKSSNATGTLSYSGFFNWITYNQISIFDFFDIN